MQSTARMNGQALCFRREGRMEGKSFLERRFEAAGSVAQTHVSFRGIRLLSAAIGTVFIWFGTLKILGASPLSELLGKMSWMIPREYFVRLVGIWEVLMGTAFLFRVLLPLTLPMFFLHQTGTLLVFVFQPQEAYRRGNPLLLTMTGEFIVKNLISLAAGIVIGSFLRRSQASRP